MTKPTKKLTTALMRAAQEGHKSVVKLMLKYKSNVNSINLEQMSPLMLASQRGHQEVVAMLIEHGADTEATTTQNSTSLMLACKRGKFKTVEVLIANGAELMRKDYKGRTAKDTVTKAISQFDGQVMDSNDAGVNYNSDTRVLYQNLKMVLSLLDPVHQAHLMRMQARIQRNFLFSKLYVLLQNCRATIPVLDSSPHFDTAAPSITIHQIIPSKLEHLISDKSSVAIVLTMALPALVMELVASYLPLPNLYEKRLLLLNRQCHIDPKCAIRSAFLFIDEILGDRNGLFLHACDEVREPPPSSEFMSWAEWRRRINIRQWQSQASNCPNTETETDQFSISLMGILVVGSRSEQLEALLKNSPYNMPLDLIRRLKKYYKLQQLVTTFVDGVHFEGSMALDVYYLADGVVSWYTRCTKHYNIIM